MLLLILLVAMSLNAIWIGTFYARFARPTIRANSVLFSDKAVIRKIGGHWYFMLYVAKTCALRIGSCVLPHACRSLQAAPPLPPFTPKFFWALS